MGLLSADANDLPGLVMFIMGSVMAYGWVNPTLPYIGEMNRTLLSFDASGYTTVISVGIALSLLGLFWILLTNRLGFRALSFVQFTLVGVTIWLILSPPFVPIMGELLSLSWAQIIAFSIQTVTVGSLSYLG